MSALRLYGDLAPWYTLLTAPVDYAEEASWYAACLRGHARRELRSVLELGCGAGANASYFKAWFELVLVDLSPAMLAQCEQINPELERIVGDMRSFRDARRFDAVFVHDAASYLLSAAELRAVAETAAHHLRPGGVALFCPDDLEETFVPGTDDGGHDGADGRALRYFSWSVAAPEHRVHTDYVYMLRSPEGAVEVVHERHVTGRLPQAAWVDALVAAGLEPQVVPFEHSEVETEMRVLVGIKPA